MKERDVRPPAEVETEAVERLSWNAAEIGVVLGRDAVDVRDVAHGDGLHFDLDPTTETTLALFPDAAVARLEWPAGRLELYRQDPPTLQSHGLRFDQQLGEHQLSLAIAANGAVTLWLAPSQPAAEAPRTGETASTGTDLPHDQETPLLGHPGAAEGSDEAPVQPVDSDPSGDRDDPEQREQPRVDLRGRVGRDPFVRRTPRGTLLARFPLAVQEEGQEQPTWHQILSFGARATRVQESVTKGQKVTVVGYPHQREIRQKDGSVRIVEEIYAVVVKPSKPNQTPAGS